MWWSRPNGFREALDQSDEAQQGGVVHGMLTFDYFAIVRTARD